MKALILSLSLFLTGLTFLHFGMVDDSMAMNAKPACASICLTANHTIAMSSVAASGFEWSFLTAIGILSVFYSILFLRESILKLRERPGPAPDILTLYAHYRI